MALAESSSLKQMVSANPVGAKRMIGGEYLPYPDYNKRT